MYMYNNCECIEGHLYGRMKNVDTYKVKFLSEIKKKKNYHRRTKYLIPIDIGCGR